MRKAAHAPSAKGRFDRRTGKPCDADRNDTFCDLELSRPAVRGFQEELISPIFSEQ